jgi:hypothetical protein
MPSPRSGTPGTPPRGGSAVVSAATGEIVGLAIRAALAPLQAEIATLTEKCLQLAALVPDVATLRERVAAAEARPPVPGPPGPAGADGRDGADGFTPDEITVAQDPADERILSLAYRRGEVTKGIGTLRLTTPRYCGVYERERGYLPGDQVTHAGGLWHCYAPTRSKPGDGEGWTLQVKRGQG